MGVVTTAGKNIMLDALRSSGITHVGLLTAQTPLTAVTAVASTDTFTKTSHGLSNGDLVILTALSGGTGLQAGNAGNADEQARVYYVIASATNTFQLALTPGGSAVDFTTDVTAVTVTKLVEVSGGSPAYARKSIAYAAAAGGVIDDSTNGAAVDVPACTVDYIGYYSAVTAGNLLVLDKTAQEVFAAQGVFTVTDSKVDLNTGP